MKRILSIMVFFSLFVSCFATGLATLSGSVHVTGNEPHTELVVVTADGKRYLVTGDLAQYLRKEKQNQTVILKGIMLRESSSKFLPGEFEVKEIVSGK